MNDPRFHSQAFILDKHYQGCGLDITGEDDEAMLAKLEASGKFVAEPKCDGIFATCFVKTSGNIFVSRNCKEKSYGLQTWQRPSLKPYTAIVGELGMGTEHAVERRDQLGHEFMDVHDAIVIEGRDVQQLGDDDRRKVLEDWWANLDHDTQARFRLLPRFDHDFVKEYRLQHEGFVLKEKGSRPYQGRGRKVRHWVKAKKAFEADMIVMDFRISKAETKVGEPMVESVLCGQFVNGQLEGLVWVGSMEQKWQREFAQNFGRYRGKVVRIRHYQQFKSGSLRHPSFHPDMFRDDKAPTECIFVK